MLSRTAQEIAQDYYSDLEQAFKTGKLNVNKLHLSEGVLFANPTQRYEGSQNVEKMFQEVLVPNIKRYQVIHHFFDEIYACTVMDCIAKNSVTVPLVEWLKIKDGKIFEIHHFLDSAQWSKAIGA